jgi:hypothetical protein
MDYDPFAMYVHCTVHKCMSRHINVSKWNPWDYILLLFKIKNYWR